MSSRPAGSAPWASGRGPAAPRSPTCSSAGTTSPARPRRQLSRRPPSPQRRRRSSRKVAMPSEFKHVVAASSFGAKLEAHRQRLETDPAYRAEFEAEERRREEQERQQVAELARQRDQ